MAINLKQGLTQKMLQKLSPQQIQLMKLLQLPTVALEQRIKQEIEENPALEEVNSTEDNYSEQESDSYEEEDREDVVEELDSHKDDFNIDDYIDEDDDKNDYKSRDDNYPEINEDYEHPIRYQQGFHENLLSQFFLLNLSETQKNIGEVIIGNIDDEGYLQRSTEALVNDLAFSQGLYVEEKEVEEVLKMIQTLEPLGVGARNLRECLMIQLKARMDESQEKNPDLNRAYEILMECFDDFSNHRYEKIQEKLKINEEEIRSSIPYITSLNPKPGGNNHSHTESPTIIPDYFLFLENGELILQLNSKNDPELRVSSAYSQMLQTYDREKNRKSSVLKEQNKEAAIFVKQRIDAARWFIELIKQRQQTLLNIMQAIIDFQREYFISGDIAKLKPMILKDISEMTNLDISTISRVTANKYIQTHFGLFLLKEFFSTSLTNEEGEKISTSKIKDALLKLIENEDTSRPYKDEELVELLKAQGFSVARRTVAKYREFLGIAVARLRRTV